jgi:hypothetical protein
MCVTVDWNDTIKQIKRDEDNSAFNRAQLTTCVID